MMMMTGDWWDGCSCIRGNAVEGQAKTHGSFPIRPIRPISPPSAKQSAQRKVVRAGERESGRDSLQAVIQ